jgi:hypothetical protein
MRSLNIFVDRMFKKSVRTLAKFFPQLVLRWQNNTLLDTPSARLLRALVLCFFSASMAWCAWIANSHWGWTSTPFVMWQENQRDIDSLRERLILKNERGLGLLVQQNAWQTKVAETQSHIDEITALWPNSTSRLTLLAQLYSMAHQQGLEVLHLQSKIQAAVQGYEVSEVQFNLKGSEASTYAFWRSLNQQFPNGRWTHLAWRLLPDQQFSWEARWALAWDAEDAYTDTGVEMLWKLTKPPSAQASTVSEHLLPNDPLSQMSVAGSAQVSDLINKGTSWALIRSGQKIQWVQPAQFLGREKRQIQAIDGEGVWLKAEVGGALTLLALEVMRP